jgi:hypothetical protein
MKEPATMRNHIATLQPLADKTAIGLSVLCTVHCLATPVVVTLLPSLFSLGLEDEAFHTWLVLFVIPLSAFALTLGCKRHRQLRVMITGFLGLLLLCLAPLLGHDVLGESGEKSLTLSSSTATLTQGGATRTAEPRPLIADDLPFPDCGYVTAINGGESFESIGWRFSPEKLFERDRLFGFLACLDVERLKAVFITGNGVFACNMPRDVLTETELDDCIESRIEIISDVIDPAWVNTLLTCLVPERVTDAGRLIR